MGGAASARRGRNPSRDDQNSDCASEGTSAGAAFVTVRPATALPRPSSDSERDSRAEAEAEAATGDASLLGTAGALGTGLVSGPRTSCEAVGTEGERRESHLNAMLFVRTPDDFRHAHTIQKWLKGYLARKYMASRGLDAGAAVTACACREEAAEGAAPLLPPEGIAAVPMLLCPAEGLGGRVGPEAEARRRRGGAAAREGSRPARRRRKPRPPALNTGSAPSPPPDESDVGEDFALSRRLNFSVRGSGDVWSASPAPPSPALSATGSARSFGRTGTYIPMPSPSWKSSSNG